MVDLILQGDDVTRQMWHMYSVFEEIFGHRASAIGDRPLKQVVVGDRIKKASIVRSQLLAARAAERPSPVTSPEKALPTTAAVPASTTETASAAAATTETTQADSVATTTIVPSSKLPKSVSSESSNATTSSPQNKALLSGASPPNVPLSSPLSSDRPSDSSSAPSELVSPPQPLGGRPATSNPLLDTIGALSAATADSDDSDLDIVYQQLRCRGRHRKPEQVRVRAQRQQIASSDPESTGYAGSNSIDSGYKSLCATPEVSDSLSSAPEVRRSASDVSASDSSTTSGRPRSLDGQDGKSAKIKMGTRSIAAKGRLSERSSPRHTAIDDVTLDHLMYLRQSLRKDAQRPSPSESIPSSVTSSSYHDCESPSHSEEWHHQGKPYSYRGGNSGSSSDSTFTGSRASSRGEDIDQEGGGESSSDFLLSGVEYYDLESIQEFPPAGNNYVTMLEEKTRRFKVITASKCPDPLSERQLSSLYRKRSESSQSVDGGMARAHHLQQQQQQGLYGVAAPPPRPPKNPSRALSRHHRPHHATDSKLTEAAIRVLEMIEDFRMEEALSRSAAGRLLPYRDAPQAAPPGSPGHYPYPQPRYRKGPGLRAGARPASTGSLMEHELDARSVASASSFAEHHVYEEIMYDLVREPPDRGRAARARMLPVPPPPRAQQGGHPHHRPAYAVDPRRVVVRSHQHARHQQQLHLQGRGALYPAVPAHPLPRRGADRFAEVEWRPPQDRRDRLPPDFPI